MAKRIFPISIGVLVVFCGLLAVAFPEPAVADHCKGKHKNDPGCGGDSGSGGGDQAGIIYDVSVVADLALGEAICNKPLFHPGDLDPPILATTPETKGPDVAYSAFFLRHLSDGGPTLVTDSGVQLADDIRIIAETNEFGQIISIQITGQPEIGKEALAHESEVIELVQAVDPLSDQSFYVHVETDRIPLWQLSRHTGGKRVAVVGEFCLGDLLYSPRL